MSAKLPPDPLELPGSVKWGAGVTRAGTRVVVLEAETLQSVVRVGMPPSSAIELGRALIRFGREVATGLTVIGRQDVDDEDTPA